MDQYISRAIRLSNNSNMQYHHGAVIYATKGPLRGAIISEGYNRRFSFQLDFQRCEKQRNVLSHRLRRTYYLY